MRRARLDGTILGRKPLNVDRAAIVQDRLSGMSLTDVGKKHRVSRGTVVRFVKLARLSDRQPDRLAPFTEQPLTIAAPA
jgi:hypothetical protein